MVHEWSGEEFKKVSKEINAKKMTREKRGREGEKKREKKRDGMKATKRPNDIHKKANRTNKSSRLEFTKTLFLSIMYQY